jgi:hypothetical protein
LYKERKLQKQNKKQIKKQKEQEEEDTTFVVTTTKNQPRCFSSLYAHKTSIREEFNNP